MNSARLEEISARCEAATEGLWEVVYAHGWALGVGVDMSKPGTILQAFEMIGNTLRKNTPDTRAAQRKIDQNAQFIAHARQDLPDCLAEIERLKKIEQCTKCKHTYPQTGATCPGHADAELPCAGFNARKALEAE